MMTLSNVLSISLSLSFSYFSSHICISFFFYTPLPSLFLSLSLCMCKIKHKPCENAHRVNQFHKVLPPQLFQQNRWHDVINCRPIDTMPKWPGQQSTLLSQINQLKRLLSQFKTDHCGRETLHINISVLPLYWNLSYMKNTYFKLLTQIIAAQRQRYQLH